MKGVLYLSTLCFDTGYNFRCNFTSYLQLLNLISRVVLIWRAGKYYIPQWTILYEPLNVSLQLFENVYLDNV